MTAQTYGVTSLVNTYKSPIFNNRAPLASDHKYDIGQIWIYKISSTQSNYFYLAGLDGNNATWTLLGGAGVYPITPYVVGPVGQAGYQTIQAGINAANAAGGGLVYVQKGTYTENLTLFNGIQILGDSEQGTFIIGTHTPPTSGTLNIFRVTLQGTAAVFSSNAAGTCAIIVEDCTLNVSNGYSFDLPNWTSSGSIALDNIGPFGTTDGGVRNTGGTGVFIFSAGLGNGTANPMILSGLTVILGSDITCPIDCQTGSTFFADNGYFTQNITFSNNSTGQIANCRISSGATAAVTQSSSGAVSILNTAIDSSNNPAITGAGAGTLSYQGLSFLSNALFAGTLTLSGSALTGTVNTSLSTGTLAIKSTSANPGDNAGFLQCSINGAVAYIPYFTNISP